MTSEPPEALRPLFTLFETLPRGGPGDDAHTLKALDLLPELPRNASGKVTKFVLRQWAAGASGAASAEEASS